jgi:hypothetical protein
MKPTVTRGDAHLDDRGTVTYNNDLVADSVKRIYFIENKSMDFKRGWQGHKIEQRWFTPTHGSFEISLVQIEHWEEGRPASPPLQFILQSKNMEVLHVPAGFVSCIQALEADSKLMVMSDYALGEIDDEFRFPLDLF